MEASSHFKQYTLTSQHTRNADIAPIPRHLCLDGEEWIHIMITVRWGWKTLSSPQTNRARALPYFPYIRGGRGDDFIFLTFFITYTSRSQVWRLTPKSARPSWSQRSSTEPRNDKPLKFVTSSSWMKIAYLLGGASLWFYCLICQGIGVNILHPMHIISFSNLLMLVNHPDH